MKYFLLSAIVLFLMPACSSVKTKQVSATGDWSIQSYENFANTLSNYPLSDLPSIQNNPEIFTQFLNSFEQPQLQNKSIDIQQRMEQGVDYISAINPILKTYLQSFLQSNEYRLELMHIMGLSLSVSRQLIPVTEAFKRTLDPKDASYQIRMDGFKQMFSGMNKQLSGSIVTIDERAHYTDEQRLILAEYILAEAPYLISKLSKQEAKKIIKLLEKTKENETHKQILSVLKQVIKKVK